MKKLLAIFLLLICSVANATTFDGTYTTHQSVSATSSLEDNTIFQNISNSYDGVALSISQAHLTIKNNVQFLNNSSVYNTMGGAIYNQSRVSITGDDVLFRNNRVRNGGAIYNDQAGSFVISGNNTIFDSNSAGNSGGAIYNYNYSEFTINGDNTEFNNNIANSGGAIFNAGGSFFNTTFTINGTGTVFYNNRSSSSGGALYNYSSSSSNIVSFIANAAVEFNSNLAQIGGAIYNTYNGEVRLAPGSLFINNSATSGNGGAIYNAGYTYIGNGTQFNGNTASGNGGAIYNDNKSKIDIHTGNNSGTVDFLTAGDSIYNAGGQINFLGTGTVNAGLTSLTSVQGYLPIINLGKASLIFDTVTLMDNTTLQSTIWKDGGVVKAGNISANTFNIANNNELKLQIAVENRNVLPAEGSEVTILIDRTGAQPAGWDSYGNPLKQSQYTLANNLLYEIEFVSDGVYKITHRSVPTPDPGDETIVDTNPIPGEFDTKYNFENASVAWAEPGFAAGYVAENLANQLYVLSQFDSTLPEYRQAIAMLSPDANDASNVVIRNTIKNGLDAIGRRLDSENIGFWAKGMYSSFRGGNKFDGATTGFMLGQDIRISKYFRIGEGFAYTRTNAATNQRNLEMNGAFNISLYGQFEIPHEAGDFYANLIFNYGAFNFTENKKALGADIASEIGATDLTLQFAAGYRLNLGGDSSISTEFGYRDMKITQDAFEDSIGQRVGGNTAAIGTIIANIKYAGKLGRVFAYGFHAGLDLELNKDNYKYIITAPNGIAYRYAVDPNADTGMSFGGNMDFVLSQASKIGLAYTGLMKGDYMEHTGEVRFNWQF